MSQNNLETLLNELGLKTPINQIGAESREIIADFLKTEQEYRKQHKIKRLLRLSGIKQVKTLAQFDWQFNPRISKEDILGFSNSHWVREASNLVLVGDTGLGKTHVAQALCYEAILEGFPTAFITQPMTSYQKSRRH